MIRKKNNQATSVEWDVTYQLKRAIFLLLFCNMSFMVWGYGNSNLLKKGIKNE